MNATVAPSKDPSPDAGVIDDARARQRRHRRTIAASLIALASIAALGLGFTHGGGTHPTVRVRPAGHLPAAARRGSTASCGHGAVREGRPSKSLLAILGVLRRPAERLDAIPGLSARGFTSAIFIRYVRRARVVDGSPYYLYPAIFGGCGTREPPHEGIMEVAQNVNFGHGLIGGTGGGGASAAAIKAGQGGVGSGPPGSATSSTVTMVVPDGVASVTLSYPAGRASGYSPMISPPFTITAPVVGNLLVATLPRSNPLGHGTAIWRAGDGRVIRAFRGLGS